MPPTSSATAPTVNAQGHQPTDPVRAAAAAFIPPGCNAPPGDQRKCGAVVPPRRGNGTGTVAAWRGGTRRPTVAGMDPGRQPRTTGETVDTWVMVVIHRWFRREF